MDLKSGYPFWAIRNGLMYGFPRLERDLRCDVLVLGGGITGALVAHRLAADGLDVAVVEQRDVAWGSTAASTAMLQYEIDTHLTELAERYGEDDAVRAYRACAEAIPLLQSLAREIGDVDFARQRSLYYASSVFHGHRLRAEFALRRRHGFDVELLSRGGLRERYGIRQPLAILSQLGARVDPYRLASRVLQRLRRGGTGVYDRTRIAHFETGARGVTARTEDDLTIRAGHLVLATGYAAQKHLDRSVAKNRSSYAFVTDPIRRETLGALRDTLVWESARPYLYLRTTGDDRLVVGGEDDDVDLVARRDASVERKAARLTRRVRKLLPQLPVQPAFSWAGTFAETDDGLPFFGAHDQHGPRVLFAMAYGGNGITYSAIGAPLLSQLIRQPARARRDPLARLFSFDRLDRPDR